MSTANNATNNYSGASNNSSPTRAPLAPTLAPTGTTGSPSQSNNAVTSSNFSNSSPSNNYNNTNFNNSSPTNNYNNNNNSNFSNNNTGNNNTSNASNNFNAANNTATNSNKSNTTATNTSNTGNNNNNNNNNSAANTNKTTTNNNNNTAAAASSPTTTTTANSNNKSASPSSPQAGSPTTTSNKNATTTNNLNSSLTFRTGAGSHTFASSPSMSPSHSKPEYIFVQSIQLTSTSNTGAICPIHLTSMQARFKGPNTNTIWSLRRAGHDNVHSTEKQQQQPFALELGPAIGSFKTTDSEQKCQFALFLKRALFANGAPDGTPLKEFDWQHKNQIERLLPVGKTVELILPARKKVAESGWKEQNFIFVIDKSFVPSLGGTVIKLNAKILLEAYETQPEIQDKVTSSTYFYNCKITMKNRPKTAGKVAQSELVSLISASATPGDSNYIVVPSESAAAPAPSSPTKKSAVTSLTIKKSYPVKFLGGDEEHPSLLPPQSSVQGISAYEIRAGVQAADWPAPRVVSIDIRDALIWNGYAQDPFFFNDGLGSYIRFEMPVRPDVFLDIEINVSPECEEEIERATVKYNVATGNKNANDAAKLALTAASNQKQPAPNNNINTALLRQQKLASVKSRLMDDEIQSVLANFAKSDKNNDGVLDRQELNAAVKAAVKGNFSNDAAIARIVDDLIAACDDNGDGRLNISELRFALTQPDLKLISKHAKIEKIKERLMDDEIQKILVNFVTYDRNGDGNLDRNELFGAVQSVLKGNVSGDAAVRQLVDDIVAACDDNGDGKVSILELRQGLVIPVGGNAATTTNNNNNNNNNIHDKNVKNMNLSPLRSPSPTNNNNSYFNANSNVSPTRQSQFSTSRYSAPPLSPRQAQQQQQQQQLSQGNGNANPQEELTRTLHRALDAEDRCRLLEERIKEWERINASKQRRDNDAVMRIYQCASTLANICEAGVTAGDSFANVRTTMEDIQFELSRLMRSPIVPGVVQKHLQIVQARVLKGLEDVGRMKRGATGGSSNSSNSSYGDPNTSMHSTSFYSGGGRNLHSSPSPSSSEALLVNKNAVDRAVAELKLALENAGQ